jgi:hypothetical protein
MNLNKLMELDEEGLLLVIVSLNMELSERFKSFCPKQFAVIRNVPAPYTRFNGSKCIIQQVTPNSCHVDVPQKHAWMPSELVIIPNEFLFLPDDAYATLREPKFADMDFKQLEMLMGHVNQLINDKREKLNQRKIEVVKKISSYMKIHEPQ